MVSNFSIFLGTQKRPKKNGSRVGESGTIEQMLKQGMSLGIRRRVPFHDRFKDQSSFQPQPLPKKGSVFAERFSHVQSLKIPNIIQTYSEYILFIGIGKIGNLLKDLESPTPKQLPGLSPTFARPPGSVAWAALGVCAVCKSSLLRRSHCLRSSDSIFVEHWGIHYLVGG
jgi:hypothetical protein